MSSFYKLTVNHIERLTPNAVALTFDVPADLKENFSFAAGQYITIKKELDGQELRRAYSISAAPSSGKLTVGIKKMTNGTFSVYANDDIAIGDVLEVMPAEGRFVFDNLEENLNVSAFAAGSGITPILSIAQTVLESNYTNRFVLVYGNQSPEETMYFNDIQLLEEKYPDRFYVQHVFSRTQEEGALFGRIDSSTVNYITKNQHKDLKFDAFYLCGPEEMISTVSETLKANGVDASKILFELFTTPVSEIKEVQIEEGKTELKVLLDDEETTFVMDKKDRILDAILKENIDAPYSCQGGVCSSCIAKVTNGKAEMVSNQILTDGEIADGFILTCQAHPTTSTIKVDFDDV